MRELFALPQILYNNKKRFFSIDWYDRYQVILIIMRLSWGWVTKYIVNDYHSKYL